MQIKPLIATPISHLFEDSINAKLIVENSDCLEVRQRSLESEEKKQFLFHIDIDITQPWDDSIRTYLKNAFIRKPELKLITFQATRCCSGENIIGNFYELSGIKYTKSELLAQAKLNISWLKSLTHNKINIGFENNNFYPTEAYETVTEPEFISAIVNDNDVFLLLDIAHAMVTAHNKGQTYHSYIDALPLHKCIQLHICQPTIEHNQIGIDAHNAPSDAMLTEVIRLVKKHKSISYLTVEYYKDLDGLICALKKIKGALLSCN